MSDADFAVGAGEQMLVRGRDIDTPVLDGLAVSRIAGGQGTGLIENLRQQAGAVRRQMHYDQNCRGKLVWQRANQLLQGSHAACGSSNHHKIALRFCHLAAKKTQPKLKSGKQKKTRR
jgi:hypothetical protein